MHLLWGCLHTIKYVALKGGDVCPTVRLASCGGGGTNDVRHMIIAILMQ